MKRLFVYLLVAMVAGSGCGDDSSEYGTAESTATATATAADPSDESGSMPTLPELPTLPTLPTPPGQAGSTNASKATVAPDPDEDKDKPSQLMVGRWKEHGRSVEVVCNTGMPYYQVFRYDEKTGHFIDSLTPAFGNPISRQATWDPDTKTMTTRMTMPDNTRLTGVTKVIDPDTVETEVTLSSEEDGTQNKQPQTKPARRLTPEQITEALALRIGRRAAYKKKTTKFQAFLVERIGQADDAEFEKEHQKFKGGRKRADKFFGSDKPSRKSGPKPALVLKGHKGKITAVSWSPDGKQLISCDSGAHDKKLEPLPGTVKVWDLASQKAVRTISDPKIASYSVSWSPDGKRLAIKGGGAFSIDGEQAPGTLSILDAANGKSLAAVEVASGHLFSGEGIFWSPDSKTVAGISGENVIIWDAATGKPVQTLDHADSEDSPLAMCWSSDGNRIAVGGSDAVVQIWDVSTGKKARKLQGPVAIKLGNRSIPLPSFNLLVQSVAWNPKGSLLASSTSSKLTIWNVAKGGPLKKFDFSAKNLAWSPDGSRLAGATQTSLGSIKNASISVGGVNGNWKKIPSHEGGVHSLAWSPDGKQLASGGSDRGRGLFQDVPTVKIWNLPAN